MLAQGTLQHLETDGDGQERLVYDGARILATSERAVARDEIR